MSFLKIQICQWVQGALEGVSRGFGRDLLHNQALILEEIFLRGP